jgi:hypothetical protein
MPEHVHLLVSEPERGKLSAAIQMLKQNVASKLRTHAGDSPFWQARYYDFNVWSERKPGDPPFAVFEGGRTQRQTVSLSPFNTRLRDLHHRQSPPIAITIELLVWSMNYLPGKQRPNPPPPSSPSNSQPPAPSPPRPANPLVSKMFCNSCEFIDLHRLRA